MPIPINNILVNGIIKGTMMANAMPNKIKRHNILA